MARKKQASASKTISPRRPRAKSATAGAIDSSGIALGLFSKCHDPSRSALVTSAADIASELATLRARVSSGSFPDQRAFYLLYSLYTDRWHVPLCIADPSGRVLFSPSDFVATACSDADRKAAIADSMRFGEPTLREVGDTLLLWAVPLLFNQELTGGIVAIAYESEVYDDDDVFRLDLRAACADLLHLAEEANLVNSSLLGNRRGWNASEQRHAEAIHSVKAANAGGVLEAYLQREPVLSSAIRRGDRAEAVALLNEILVAVYHHSRGRMPIIKSFVMELVVTMCRTAAEAGGNVQDLLGANYARLTELSYLHGEEELSNWLANMLNRILDAMTGQARRPALLEVQDCMAYLQAHFSEPLTRDNVSHIMGLSPSRLSHLLKEKTGRSFTDLLNQIRVDKAANWLRASDRSVLQIAMAAGFNDQSYFSKVFRRHTGETPKEYRARCKAEVEQKSNH